VGQDETVGVAAIVNGPATIEGTVRESVVVVNGDVDVSGTVRQDVIVFNGDLVVRSGAEVDGDLVTSSTPTVEDGAIVRGSQEDVRARFDFGDVGIASRIAWWIGYSASSLVLGLVLLALFPGLDASAVDAWRNRIGDSIGWGVGLFFLLPLVIVVLFITVVAIPLAVALLLALALIYSIGYVVGVTILGRLLIKPPTSRFLAFVVGWVIARALALIPVIGGLAFAAASVVGLGVLMVIARQRGSTSTAVVAETPTPPAPA
jgi:hypothetical protein